MPQEHSYGSHTELKSFQYWLIGLPGTHAEEDDRTVDCWDKVHALSKKYSENYRFPMPDLRVGTLDHLLTASIQLERLESTVEAVVSKIIHAMVDVLDLKMEKMDEYLIVKGVPIPEYLSKFKWDPSKYCSRQTMKGIEDQIDKEMIAIELETKTLLSEYVAIRSELASLDRNEKGSLLTRNVSEFVKKNDFVPGSDHLITVLVVVPKTNYEDWYNKYELLDNEVVPRSTSLLHEDTEFGLFNVTLFKRHLEQFRYRAKQVRFYVKDFIYNEERILEERHHLSELRQMKTLLFGPLVRALRNNFSDSYISFTHLKMMRMFVECVLRYGLPANYLGIIMVVPKRNVKKLRELMFKEFAYLDGSLPKEEKENKEEKEFPSRVVSSSNYFPYVSIKINVEPGDFKQDHINMADIT